METNNEKQLTLDRRYIRMATIWAENSYCTRRQVGALSSPTVTMVRLQALRIFVKTRTM